MATKLTTRTGYAVFNSNGEMLWFTIRSKKSLAVAAYNVETGDPLPESFEVKPVTITEVEK